LKTDRRAGLRRKCRSGRVPGGACFYYGDHQPIGFCATNGENGLMIDVLVVPLIPPKPDHKDKQGKATEAKSQPDAAASEPPAPEATAPQDANGQEPKPATKSRKGKA